MRFIIIPSWSQIIGSVRSFSQKNYVWVWLNLWPRHFFSIQPQMYNLHVVYLFVSKRYSSTNSQLVFRVVWVTDITGPLMIFHTNHQLTDTQRLNMFDFYVYVIDFYVYVNVCIIYIYMVVHILVVNHWLEMVGAKTKHKQITGPVILMPCPCVWEKQTRR